MSRPRSYRSPAGGWKIRGLVALGVVAFIVAVMANAAQASVLSPGYYQQVLKDEDVYDRAFTELSRDPPLTGVAGQLLGGAEIPFVDAIPGMLIDAIPVQLVETMVDQAIEDLIAYFKKHGDLKLTLDITPFVDGVGSPAFDDAIDGLGDLIGEESPVLDDILDGLEERGLDDLIPGGGNIPFPTRDRSMLPSPYSEASPLALARSGDEGAGPKAPRFQVPGFDIKSSKYVHEEEIDGETHYLLGPPQETIDKIDDALFAIQLISSNSYWLRPLGIALFVVALVGLGWLSRSDSAAMTRRIGLVLLIGGMIVFLGWLAGMPILHGVVIDAAFEGSSIPSEVFDDLARDVLRRAVNNLTPYVWFPGLIAAGIGFALVLVPRFAAPRRRTAVSAPAAIRR